MAHPELLAPANAFVHDGPFGGPAWPVTTYTVQRSLKTSSADCRVGFEPASAAHLAAASRRRLVELRTARPLAERPPASLPAGLDGSGTWVSDSPVVADALAHLPWRSPDTQRESDRIQVLQQDKATGQLDLTGSGDGVCPNCSATRRELDGLRERCDTLEYELARARVLVDSAAQARRSSARRARSAGRRRGPVMQQSAEKPPTTRAARRVSPSHRPGRRPAWTR